MPKSEPRDLSKATGRRIRIRFDEYDYTAQQFKPIKGLLIKLNARDRPQIDRLYKRVGDSAEELIRAESGQ